MFSSFVIFWLQSVILEGDDSFGVPSRFPIYSQYCIQVALAIWLKVSPVLEMNRSFQCELIHQSGTWNEPEFSVWANISPVLEMNQSFQCDLIHQSGTWNEPEFSVLANIGPVLEMNQSFQCDLIHQSGTRNEPEFSVLANTSVPYLKWTRVFSVS